MSADVNGVIHDMGYQRYTGARLGRAYAVRSLYTESLRVAFGLGRGAKAKIFPWIVIGILTLVAVVIVAVAAQTGGMEMPYVDFPQSTSLLIVLFGAVVSPELVSRDLRSGVLSLYFSRPLTRSDYPLAKLAALVTALWLILAGPALIMFLGAAFSVDTFGEVWPELGRFGEGLGAAAVYALIYGSLALLVASLAGRRAIAAAMVVAAFLITTPIFAVLAEVSDQGEPMDQLAGLVSPLTTAMAVSGWLFVRSCPARVDCADEFEEIGPYGPVYALTALGFVLACAGLLLLRYRKVAR
jgi:ABC-2 type transport system permease protein